MWNDGKRESRTFLHIAAAAAKLLRLCLTLGNPIDGSPPGSPHPWDSPGKNTGVGCHFLLQCMKVKSEREVAQLCPTLSDRMDCSLPGSSLHAIFQARVLQWGAIVFSDSVHRSPFLGDHEPYNLKGHSLWHERARTICSLPDISWNLRRAGKYILNPLFSLLPHTIQFPNVLISD